MLILKRYLFDYILYLSLSIIAWFTSIYYFDGIIPNLVGLATLVLAFGYIPYMMKQDYNTVKECVDNAKLVKNGEMSKKDFSIDVLKKVCDETGLPEFVVDYSLKKMKVTK